MEKTKPTFRELFTTAIKESLNEVDILTENERPVEHEDLFTIRCYYNFLLKATKHYSKEETMAWVNRSL